MSAIGFGASEQRKVAAPSKTQIASMDKNPYAKADMDYALRGFMIPHSAIRLYTYWLLDAVEACVAFTEDDSIVPLAFIAALNDWYSKDFYFFIHHHHLEEDIFFPWIADRMKEKSLGEMPQRISAERKDLVDALEKIKGALAELQLGPAEGKAVVALKELVEKMAMDMFEHINEEERMIVPFIRQCITEEELTAKEQDIGRLNGLSGARKMLPIIIEGMTFYDPTPAKEHLNKFVNNLPLPLRWCMWMLWTPAFKKRQNLIINLGQGKVPTGGFFYGCSCGTAALH